MTRRAPASLLALLALAATVPAASQPGASFTFPDEPDFVVVEYHQSHAMLEEVDPVPLMRVYGNGVVRVHQPRHRIDAGDYELVLSASELRQLLLALTAKNVPSADVAELARARDLEERRRAAQEGKLHAISDDTVTHIVVHFESFTPAPGARALANHEQRIAWPNLQADAERFPELPQIAELAAAERELRALLERPDLRRIQ